MFTIEWKHWYVKPNFYFQFEKFSLSAPGQWLEIRDGSSREATLIARATGDKMDDIILSSGPSLHIHLQTDLEGGGRGFNFTYQSGLYCHHNNKCEIHRKSNDLLVFVKDV